MKNNHTRRGFTQKVVNKNCHSRMFLSGISRIRICKREEQPLLNERIRQKGDPRLKASGMTPNFITARGFTLIELLVAVLIIAVLAAVAVPQYQKAVRKAKLVEVGTMFSSISKAVDIWLLENGYPSSGIDLLSTTTHSSLGIDVPCNERDSYGCITNMGHWVATCEQNNCSIDLFHTSNISGSKQFTWLSAENSSNGKSIRWEKSTNGLWKLTKVLTDDSQLRKQVCQWWRENYGAELMVGTAARTHCKE